MARKEDSEDYVEFSGRTPEDCGVLDVLRRAHVPVRIDRSRLLALVNGQPIARLAQVYEKGALHMERSVRVRLDEPQALYIGNCLEQEALAAQLPAGKSAFAAYWRQLREERLTPAGLFIRVPLHIAPHGIDFMAEVDLSGNDILDISLALGDFDHPHMARLWAQLYASLAWDVAREILPTLAMRGRDYLDFATIEGRQLFEIGMEKRDREHGIKRRSLREFMVFHNAGRREHAIFKS